MRSLRVLAVVFAVVAPGVARPALAQSTGGLGGLLLRFFSDENPVVLAGNANPAFSHAAHFVSQQNARDTMRQINAGIAAQLATFPVGSSSGGFTYTFDESLGVYSRTTESFGPIFGERPLTAGRGKFSLAVNYQHGTWDTLEGLDLRGDDMQLYLLHDDVNHDGSNRTPWFEGDLIRADLSLDLKTDTTVLFANYGLSERLDVGVAVPFQRVELDARHRHQHRAPVDLARPVRGAPVRRRHQPARLPRERQRQRHRRRAGAREVELLPRRQDRPGGRNRRAPADGEGGGPRSAPAPPRPRPTSSPAAPTAASRRARASATRSRAAAATSRATCRTGSTTRPASTSCRTGG